MVIGNGMIATRFSNYAENGDVLIFASGVSHSASATATDFARERALLLETMQLHPGKLLVYFSTCSAVSYTHLDVYKRQVLRCS